MTTFWIVVRIISALYIAATILGLTEPNGYVLGVMAVWVVAVGFTLAFSEEGNS